MTLLSIERVIEFFAAAARRAQRAGFDGVEIQGGMGHLIAQFLSPSVNQRTDAYGGSLENRMRFALQLVDAVLKAVGKDYPVGYRLLAYEWLDDGVQPEEAAALAVELDKRGIAYLSVLAGAYESHFLPEFVEDEKAVGYMVRFADEVTGDVKTTPVIVSGRIQTPDVAHTVLDMGQADLIGLGRVLFADPLWPKKAAGLIDEPVVKCGRTCSLCMKRATMGRRAMCNRWDKEHRLDVYNRVKEAEAASEGMNISSLSINYN
ncbi:MAG: NADH:flavin oxidoreductase, partial [Acidobacteriota bacterium]